MKKTSAIILALVMLACVFSGCSKQPEQPSSTDFAEITDLAQPTVELSEKPEKTTAEEKNDEKPVEEKKEDVKPSEPNEPDEPNEPGETDKADEQTETDKSEELNETDPDAKWQIMLDDTAFLQPGETLVQAYGIDETYAIAYASTGDTGWGLNGRVLLIDRQSAAVKQELYNVTTDESGIPYEPFAPLQIGEQVLFGWRTVYTTGWVSHYCTIVNGSVKTCLRITDDFYQGDGVFQKIEKVCGNDIDSDTDPELFFQHFSWAYLTYWYFWSEDALDLREYQGIAITREELEQLEAGDSAVQQDIQKTEQDGYVFDIMYLRGNGILNVNFYKEQEGYRDFVCRTYQYSNGLFVPYPDTEQSFNAGRYEASCWKDEYCEAVVFPPLAAIRNAQ